MPVASPAQRLTYLVTSSGSTQAVVGAAVHGPVSVRLNDFRTATFELPVSSSDVTSIVSTVHREAMLKRGSQTLVWGPITDVSVSDGILRATVADAAWHLTGRFVGPVGGPVNRVVNGDFEDGSTGWGFAKTSGLLSFTTYTSDFAETDWNTDDEVVVFEPLGVAGFQGGYALRLWSPDLEEDNSGDLFGWQEITVSTGTRPLVATLSARVYLSSSILVRYPPFNRGLGLHVFPTDFDQSGTNGGKNGWFTDIEEWESSRIDDDTPRDRWVRQECSIEIPPNSTRILHVRLNGGNCLLHYDRVRLHFDTDALTADNAYQGAIISQIVAHAQDVAFGKTSVNLSVVGDVTTGKQRSLYARHEERADCWSLIQNFTRLDDGVDLTTGYTATQRLLEVSEPNAGSVRGTDMALWHPGNVATLNSWELAAGQAATHVTTRASNEGGTDWASASNSSGFAAMREANSEAEIEATLDDLDDDAAEALAEARATERFVVTLNPDQTDAYLESLQLGDWLPTNIVYGGLSIVGTYRCVGWTLTPDDLLVLEMSARAEP